MNLKPILTACTVVVTALVQPALADWTYDKNGEPTHYKGVPLPSFQTVEETRAGTLARLKPIQEREAREKAEREAAAKIATRDPLPATAPQELFFTGKPYLEETGQYLFLFRHYDPELARWTTADPSGFPDGANNIAYVAVPTNQFDWQGLKSVIWVYLWDNRDLQRQELFAGLINSEQSKFKAELERAGGYLDDGDTFTFEQIANINQLSSLTADKIWIAAHGWSGIGGLTGGWQVLDYTIGGSSEITTRRSTDQLKALNQNIVDVNGCSPIGGNIKAHQVVQPWKQPTRDYLKE